MAPSRRKGVSKAAAAAAAKRQWKVGDLVLAKVKGFPAWPATVSEPEKWGYSIDWKKVFVHFFGTQQIGFCNPADVEEFTEEKKVSLSGKGKGRGADFVRAVQEIVDCYDKLKERSRFSSVDAPDKNASDQFTAADPTTLDVTHDCSLKSSDSHVPNDEPSPSLEDVGNLNEVESLRQRGASEEPPNNVVAPILAMPNTCNLPKKARSYQVQRCTIQKKDSFQRSRSSSRCDSHGLQNDVSNCNGEKNSVDGTINGFWDGPLRKSKRSRRSPEGSIPSVEDSPVCNSNGTLDDHGSEVAMPDGSERLSYNEDSAVESEHKCEQLEIVNGSCEGDLEVSTMLDCKPKPAIVRKKRNPGRKRARRDGRGFTSRPDRHVTLLLSATCGNVCANQLKNEGDEHLPLVKRARVRMGELLSEDQPLCAPLAKNEETSPKSGLIYVAREVDPAVICNDSQLHENVLISNEPIVSSPINNCSQEPEDKPQPQKTHSCSVSDAMICSPSVTGAQTSEVLPQTSKAKTSQPYGGTYDCESALPPSKRLHRALEAMSANAAEVTQSSVVEVSCSRSVNKDINLPLRESCSDMVVKDEPCNNSESQTNLPNCDIASHCSHVEVSTLCTPFTCDVSMAIEDVDISAPFDKDLAACSEDNIVGMAVSIDSKDHCISDSFGMPHDAPEDQALQDAVTNAIESMPMLETSSTVHIKPFPEEFGKAGKDIIVDVVAENNKSVSEFYYERGTDLVSPKATIKRDDSTMILSGAANDIPSASVNEDANASCLGGAREAGEVKHTTTENMEASSSRVNDSSPERTCNGASTSGSLSHDHKHGLHPDDLRAASNSNGHAQPISDLTVGIKRPHSMHGFHPDDLRAASSNGHTRPIPDLAVGIKRPHSMHVSDIGEIKCLDTVICHQSKSSERTNLAEVKAALASLELTLESLCRTKESIGRATRIAVDCVNFGVAAEVVELLVLYLEKEVSMHRRIDLFFLVDSIAQCCRSLKGDVGGSYFSAVKETLARMLSAAAPAGLAARDNRRQCLKVLRLWLERKILPESIIRHHIQELDSQNCSSSGFCSRMSRTDRSFDDPILDMEGMVVDEYGSNSSFQLSEFCMLRMVKEEEEEVEEDEQEEKEDDSDSDSGNFEAVTPEHDSKFHTTNEPAAFPAAEKHRHILEDVDGELEMEDVAPSCERQLDTTSTSTVVGVVPMHRSQKQFTRFVPPLPHDMPPRLPPPPQSPLPLPPLPPPPPPPRPPAPHATAMPHIDPDPHLHTGRNGQRPSITGVNCPSQIPTSTSSCSYNSYPMMHNVVAPGNNLQPVDANLYANKAYDPRPSYHSPSNHFSYHPPDQQFRPPREGPPPSYYNRNHFGSSVDGHFYGDQDKARPPRPEFSENWGASRSEITESWAQPRQELRENWGYCRPSLPSSRHSANHYRYQPSCAGPSCEARRSQNRGWAYPNPPHPVHHQNHIPCGPPCDGGVPERIRDHDYWRPR